MATITKEQPRLNLIIIFTNLTQDHLNFHPTWEHYKKAKLEYFVESKKTKKKSLHPY